MSDEEDEFNKEAKLLKKLEATQEEIHKLMLTALMTYYHIPIILKKEKQNDPDATV